ncbi:DNA mismatch repair protein MutS [Psychroflexus sp. YR1-1]|uniref:DNA mismatch repair protein MutS n=1 Tax=Psychroflexus aurantiacus TaxID=2709310 RepID=A0A6B3R476_9FLAO|nr:DNA mismatch repair protein MutS [Psychroflexus aurantiacus]NEV93967.1 DNA mismatch repair protein MutS [Psychroflexus aurantiacus]
MPTPGATYSEFISRYTTDLKAVKTQLFWSSMLRLAVFLAIAFAVYFFWSSTRIVIGSIILGIITFLILVTRHSKIQYKKAKLVALLQLNETELQVLKREFSDLPAGEEYKNPEHEFSQDIDIFGKHSFFQYLNRTALKEGEENLAAKLTSNSIDDITSKQEAIQELAQKVELRQNFTADAMLVDTETKASSIVTWITTYKTFVPKWMSWFPRVFSVISLVVITAYFFNLITGAQLLLWFVIGLGITGVYLKRVSELSSHVSQAQSTFQQYFKLLKLIEDAEFDSTLLKAFQSKIHSESAKASQILQKLSKHIDALDQRNNIFLGPVLNGFMLRDLTQSLKIEKWISAHADQVQSWFEVIAEVDAYNSLANFHFNHPHYVFPEIKANGSFTKTKGAVHPLIDPKDAVRNDFEIKDNQFFIITGANMAGKSTFLRTVSLQIVMSNVGLPVCATSCAYVPTKLITSMRTVDSLADEASYFFAELTRLKYIVDEIQTDKYFIVLDEILKGTNSTDKAIGSRKFVERLVKANAIGIIATHDLSLCEVADALPQVKNYYFDAEIIDDELHFDYTLKAGVCKNMNASFLLKKMDIVE